MNIIEILKKCPKGTKLYSPIFGECKFVEVFDGITVMDKHNNNRHFYQDGRYHELGDCVLFPSKEERDWNKFQTLYVYKNGDLEKLIKPKFKVGDVIQDRDGYKIEIMEIDIDKEYYWYISKIAKGVRGISFKDQDEYELVPNKFDISTLKPFESRVLVRNHKSQIWKPAIFGGCVSDYFDGFKYIIIGEVFYKYLIPYENNEYLLGTTKCCKDYYKTWKE